MLYSPAHDLATLIPILFGNAEPLQCAGNSDHVKVAFELACLVLVGVSPLFELVCPPRQCYRSVQAEINIRGKSVKALAAESGLPSSNPPASSSLRVIIAIKVAPLHLALIHSVSSALGALHPAAAVETSVESSRCWNGDLRSEEPRALPDVISMTRLKARGRKAARPMQSLTHLMVARKDQTVYVGTVDGSRERIVQDIPGSRGANIVHLNCSNEEKVCLCQDDLTALSASAPSSLPRFNFTLEPFDVTSCRLTGLGRASTHKALSFKVANAPIASRALPVSLALLDSTGTTLSVLMLDVTCPLQRWDSTTNPLVVT